MTMLEKFQYLEILSFKTVLCVDLGEIESVFAVKLVFLECSYMALERIESVVAVKFVFL